MSSNRSVSDTTSTSPNSLKAVAHVLSVITKGVEAADASIRFLESGAVAAEVVANNNDKVAQKQDTALEVVALPFAVHVAQKEDAQDDCDHIPLWEEEAKGIACHICDRYIRRIDGGE